MKKQSKKKGWKERNLTFGEIQDKQLEFDGPSHVSHPVSHAIRNFERKKMSIIKIKNKEQNNEIKK